MTETGDETISANSEQAAPAPNPKSMNIADPNLPTVYANDTHVMIGPSEISIVFGHDIDPFNQNGPVRPLVRVVMTHDQFIRFMGFLKPRLEFISSVYDNSPTSLVHILQKSPDDFMDKWNKMQNIPTE